MWIEVIISEGARGETLPLRKQIYSCFYYAERFPKGESTLFSLKNIQFVTL